MKKCPGWGHSEMILKALQEAYTPMYLATEIMWKLTGWVVMPQCENSPNQWFLPQNRMLVAHSLLSGPCGWFEVSACAGREGPWICLQAWIVSMLGVFWELSQADHPDCYQVFPSAARGVGNWGGNTHPGIGWYLGDEGQTSADILAHTFWQHFQFHHYLHL